MKIMAKIKLYSFPFISKSEDKSGRFSKDMELATIFWETEAKRKKENEILGTKGEEIRFISYGYYPIWVAPINDSFVMIDGMMETAHKFLYHKISNLESFINDLNAVGNQRDILNRTLTRYLEAFKPSPLEREENIEGLITEQNLQKELLNILNQIHELDEKTTEKAIFLDPLISPKKVDLILEQLKILENKISTEFNNVEKASKLLNEKINEQTNQIESEISEIEKNYNRQISDTKPIVEKEIEELEKDRLKEIKQITDHFEANKTSHLERLKDLGFEIKTREREKTILRKKIEICKKKKDRDSEKIWKKTLDSKNEELKTLGKESRKILKDLENLEKNKNSEIQRCKTCYDLQIIEKMKPLRDLETKMQIEINHKRIELEELKKNYSKLNENIHNLSTLTKEDARKLATTVPKKNISEKILLMIPFYASSFRSGGRRRFSIFSPSIAVDKKGLLKSIFQRMGKTEFPLTNAYEGIKDLLEVKFARSINENPVLKNDVSKLGEKSNILKNKDQKIAIKLGLEQLADQDWLSEKKYKELSDSPLLK